MMRRFLIVFAALAVGALVLYTYRDLFARPFAADDYEWLLNVRGLSFAGLVRRAFDAGEQTHFYRPLVWVLFWAQLRVFGLAPQGFHVVSLALHLLSVGLLAGLAWRLIGRATMSSEITPASRAGKLSWQLLAQLLAAFIAALFVALHPAPFEAVVWISGQSELLAAVLLLLALHLWLPGEDKETRRQGDKAARLLVSLSPCLPLSWPRMLGASLVLGLALLAKESAVIGLPLLALIGWEAGSASNLGNWRSWLLAYLPPTLLTLGYLAIQLVVEQRNYLLRQGGYGLGPQLLLNPLRSLGLIVAPLPSSEHADVGWLVPLGGLVALGLVILLLRGSWPARRLVLALGLTLLPTAPFTAPPNSRYLYLPVLAAALLIGLAVAQLVPYLLGDSSQASEAAGSQPRVPQRLAAIAPWLLALVLLAGALLWARAASGELQAREGRFAAGTGPGGSLWRLTSTLCAERRPDRLIVVEPPVAEQHVVAIGRLACGARVRTLVVGRDGVAGALEGHAVVISFPNGSAQIEQST